MLRTGPECIVLDLGRLRFIDSSGIRNVLELHTRCLDDGIRLVIIPGSCAVHRPFEISGLDKRLPFVSDEQ